MFWTHRKMSIRICQEIDFSSLLHFSLRAGHFIFFATLVPINYKFVPGKPFQPSLIFVGNFINLLRTFVIFFENFNNFFITFHLLRTFGQVYLFVENVLGTLMIYWELFGVLYSFVENFGGTLFICWERLSICWELMQKSCLNAVFNSQLYFNA